MNAPCFAQCGTCSIKLYMHNVITECQDRDRLDCTNLSSSHQPELFYGITETLDHRYFSIQLNAGEAWIKTSVARIRKHHDH